MNILAFGAHPDDIEICCAGTLAKFKKRGDEIYIAVVTNGEVGSPTLPKEEIAAVRKDEAEKSASILGANFIWMGFPDGFLFHNEETRLKFIDVIRQTNPDLIFTHCPDDYHIDHRNVSRIVDSVRVMVTVPNIKTETPPAKKFPALYFMDTIAGIGFLPETYVDITETFPVKIKMLKSHKSQSLWLENQYGISYTEFTEIISRYRGLQSGYRYAESFIETKQWPHIHIPLP